MPIQDNPNAWDHINGLLNNNPNAQVMQHLHFHQNPIHNVNLVPNQPQDNNIDEEAVPMIQNNFLEEPDDNFNIHVKKMKADLKKKLNGIPNKKFNFKEYKPEELTFKTFLTNNRRRVVHIQYPKEFIGTNDELINNCYNGVYGFNEVNEIPNPRLKINTKKNNLFLKQHFINIPKVNNIESCTDEEFYEKTNKYFTLLNNNYIGDYNDSLTFNLTIKTDSGKCEPNVYMYGKTLDDIYVRGITTGKYLLDGSQQVEIIGCQINIEKNSFNNNYLNARFDKRCLLKRYYIYYKSLTPIRQNRPFDFCRLKIKGFEESSAFGFKQIKKKMLGEVFTPDKFKIIRNFESVKLKKTVDIVEVDSKNSGKIKFTLNDVEFYYLNKDELLNLQYSSSNKKIIKGSICRLIDNRRTILNRNDIVTVLNIDLAKENYKNSIITIRDNTQNKKIHKVFLKQLKIYNEIK